MSIEKWLPVVGFEDLYQISDLGRVWSKRGNKLLRVTMMGGYPMVNFSLNGVQKGKIHTPSDPAKSSSAQDRLDRKLVISTEIHATRFSPISPGEPAVRTSPIKVEHGTHPEASRTHCDNGHEWTEKNTRIECYPDGTFKARRCRECARIESAKRREQRETDGRRCKEDDCDKPYFGRGWCTTHYNEWCWRCSGGQRAQG